MKKNLTYLLLIPALVAMVYLTGCNSTSRKVQKDPLEIPALFERTGELANAAEWPQTKQKVAELIGKLKNQPNEIKPRLQLATIYMSEARVTGEHPYYYPAILQILDGVLSLDSKNFEALTYKSSVLMSQHQFTQALQTATEAKNINPDNAYIYGVLVDANVELGNYEEAIAMSDMMQKIKPSLESYSRASYLREIYGDYPGAIEAMELAVSAGLPGSEPYCWSKNTLGYLYEQTGQNEKARMQYQGILNERPSYAFAMEGLARLEMKNKNYAEAKKILNDAIEIMPEFSFHEMLAEIYAREGDEKKSQEKYEEVVEMLKEDAASGHIVHLDLSKLYVQTNNWDSASFYIQKEYEVRPKNIEVNRVMAQIELAKNNIQKAKSYLEVASRTGNKNPELVELQAKIQLLARQSETAGSVSYNSY